MGIHCKLTVLAIRFILMLKLRFLFYGQLYEVIFVCLIIFSQIK